MAQPFKIVLTLYGPPRTKKNSMRQIKGHSKKTGREYTIPLPSKAYETYEADCDRQIPAWAHLGIDYPINLKCVYYMPTYRRVDLVNLLEATCDILHNSGVIADDNNRIVASHDGCRVKYDKQNPRTEIEITEATSDAQG